MAGEEMGFISSQPVIAGGSEPSAAFTPGPWRVDPHHSQDVQTLEGHEICAVLDSSELGKEWTIAGTITATEAEATANARLIAAAPDLYEALKACRSKFEEYALLHYRKQTADGDEKALANQIMATLCDEALAKAEGQ